ncbi:hypothetical protein SODALDRAFT_198895 [Sodiomyces alkalinus F11]|uniref:Uncharacterized protein n=1 Tax=Sodiomyces alkalinus (strain CBS 110278 / VKM F-3762 / F11) TaxID=1314773 RepID=A0A3N2PSM6_SODAK|nr:hypothetical protein SODALDRAFT_198895 [Sodiomyces alkalinus F11]ROT37512.1 hypothetical protein SODALDRAFT_198895 [Sodiomyces alkalinus F11]
MAIEVPQIRKLHSAPGGTPPEPLSARGDVPGGYFPLHEDPNSRVHRPHPFCSENRKSRHEFHLSLELPSTFHQHGSSAPLATMPEFVRSAVDLGNHPSHTPVASYLPSGAPDTLLPMGKYYPSNYETWNRSPQHQGQEQPIPRSAALNGLASMQSDPQVPARSTVPPRHDSEVKRMFQQYQRDMVAQARLAASEVLNGVSISSQDSVSSVALNSAPLKTLRGSNTHKPTAPRLLPLGSPGPVTPMDLEEGEEGGYMGRGRQACSPLGEGEQVTMMVRADETCIRRESASPS